MSADKSSPKEGERRISEIPGNEKNAPERQNWFRKMAQRLGPLVAGAFLAVSPANVGCGSATADDVEDDADVSADVQPDEGDVQEDSANPDVSEVDDGALDAMDEGSVDADVEDTPDVLDITDELEALDEGSGDIPGDEADVPVCEPVTRMEERAPEPAGTICGSVREKVVTVQVTEYGEGCETVGTETSLESIEYRITPPLDYSGERDPLGGLVCASGNETELLNPGTYMIISLSPVEIQMGLKLASALNMSPSSPPLNGGTHQLQLRGISGIMETENRLLDAAGVYMGERIFVPGQGRGGFIAIDINNGAFAWGLDGMSASQAIIRLEGGNPVVVENPGTMYYEVPGDEGWFETRILIGGSPSEITGYGFYRDHH